MPTTTAVGPADLRDRIDRGGARFVIANTVDTVKFDECPATTVASRSPAASPRPTAGRRSTTHTGSTCRRPSTRAPRPTDRLLLYFTSGTTSKPKLVEHTQVSYPVGHLSTMYWLGLEPGDVHLNISSPGWAKHAWSCFFAPWNAEATVFLYNYTRFDAAALLGVIRDNEVTSLCAPPTVWRMLINADLSGGPGRLREIIGAGEPLNPEVIEQVKQGVGPAAAGRLRPDRDHGPGRQHAGVTGEGRLDGPTAAGRSRGSRGSADRRTRLGHGRGSRRRARSAWT